MHFKFIYTVYVFGNIKIHRIRNIEAFYCIILNVYKLTQAFILYYRAVYLNESENYFIHFKIHFYDTFI